MKKGFLMFTICLVIICFMAPQAFATTCSESNGANPSQTEKEYNPYTIAAHGQYAMSAKASISMRIEWQGSASYLVLLTKEDYKH